MMTLNNCSDSNYLVLRIEDLCKEEYDEIIDFVKQVISRDNKKRLIQELDFIDSWMTLRNKHDLSN